jgi:hypothetical protein
MTDEKRPTTDGAMPEDEKKRVDEDWKREARAEKERLAREKEQERKAPRPAPMPPASFELVVTNYALQALIALGDIANPVTRKQELDLEQAKHAIDLLGVLEEKTKGNLTDDEKKHLQDTLYDLRMRYVQHVQR